MKPISKKIAILCTLDSFANSIRPMEIKKYLLRRGYKVTLVNNGHVYKGSKSFTKFQSNNIYKIMFNLVDEHLNGWPYYFYLMLKLKIREYSLLKLLKRNNYDVLICENHIQAYVARNKLNCVTILDLDSPYIDELYYSGKIFESQRKKLNDIFKKIYQKVNYLNFHWFRYTDYVKENIYNGKNIVKINYGCSPKDLNEKAKFNSKPRIVCLGYLGGKWVNLPLLSKLSKLYPIEVYGGPPPDKKWGLNYKGYAPTTDILKDYQFGLITITKEKLRRSSFSSKHLEYLSYGLPVLTPEWRQDILLKDVSIYFNEDNFLGLIKKYSNPERWQQMSDACYRQAKLWKWENVLKPLGEIVNKSSVK